MSRAIQVLSRCDWRLVMGTDYSDRTVALVPSHAFADADAFCHQRLYRQVGTTHLIRNSAGERARRVNSRLIELPLAPFQGPLRWATSTFADASRCHEHVEGGGTLTLMTRAEAPTALRKTRGWSGLLYWSEKLLLNMAGLRNIDCAAASSHTA
jgi:hypothetical protein